MYDWGPHSGFALLLLHNAVAVLVAVALCPVLRGRILIALLATAAAVGSAFLLHDVSVSHRVGWWILLDSPFENWDRTLEDRVVCTYTLLAGVVAPFVFSLFATWRWARRGRCTVGLLQIRLVSCAYVVSVACMGLGFYNWCQKGSVMCLPLIVLALLFVIRPYSLFKEWRTARLNRERLLKARSRWGSEDSARSSVACRQ